MLPGLRSAVGTHVDGAIGTSFLDHFLSTIDYRRKLLVLRPASDSAAFEADAAHRNADLRTMWLVGDHFIFATAHVNDAPEALFNIDTGGGGIGAAGDPFVCASTGRGAGRLPAIHRPSRTASATTRHMRAPDRIASSLPGMT